MYVCMHICIYISLYLYVPNEGSLLPKYRDCSTPNDFELYLMCCGVTLLLLTMYIYIYICVYFISQHHPSLTDIKVTLKKFLPILYTSERMSMVFSRPPVVSFYQPKEPFSTIMSGQISRASERSHPE